MSDLTHIAIVGASGRMGQMLIRAVNDSTEATLSGVAERAGHGWIGQDLGVCMGGHPSGVIVSDDPLEVFAKSQAVIDFTSPDATVAHAALAAQARLVHVIGTTGLDADHLAKLSAAARHCAIVRAGNMSLGVNLLVQLTGKVAAALDEDFDIEIVEAHHRHKVDAPSGTALMLGQAAAAGRGISLDDHAVRVRDGHTGARRRGDIGFATLRGGSVVGEHTVMFVSDVERIELTHRAVDRGIFARGAVKAALWGFNNGAPKGPGLFSMQDVLGL